ncbi:MAG: tetratricopeptide repeat protein, partial [Anaerolineae bacterium]|nr:tetratricopeptide repeat protein [Anaerolineae bacterium]
MPEIRLQEYTAKIKELIHNDLHDDAIAHCQHILRHHPKHIETYSLLGEACLEKQMLREAIEFFQRTLSADPESFIARVGLGIIYDAQGAFPEAVWQFERAFELAPGNSEVRRELQRLYAQRDGAEKTRLKLTRGALGRLYSRNGLYERAIAEFHAVLRDEPDLPDVRVALAEALWREGRRLEAVETCLDILEALPNCLKANLILGEIWVRGGHEDAGEDKLRLARELDPENLMAQELMGRESPLPPQEVYLEERTGAPQEFGVAPAGEEELLPAVWGMAEEGAVDIVEGAARDEWDTGEAMPDWMQEMGMAATAAAQGDVGPEGTEQEGEMLPDWLQELMGDEIPSGQEEVAPLPSGGPAMGDQEIEEGEIPDWLHAMDLQREEPRLAEEVEVESPAAEVPGYDLDMREEALAPEEAAVEVRADAAPESLRALVEAGILDESDLEAALAEMSP